MDTQTIINFVLTTVSAVIGWFARELWSAVKELKADLAKLREELPKSYIAKDDYRSDMHDIKDMLSKIFDKLDGKQDK
jgi:predicted RNA-binding protein with EMAP domain